MNITDISFFWSVFESLNLSFVSFFLNGNVNSPRIWTWHTL